MFLFSWFRSPHGSIKAKPNPVPTTEQEPNVGATTLEWRALGTEVIEVRLGAPDGPLALAKKPHSLLATLGVVRVTLIAPHFAQEPAPAPAPALARAAAAGAVGNAGDSAVAHAAGDAGEHANSDGGAEADQDDQEGEYLPGHLTAMRTSVQAAG
jgi:hypothetical protein